MSTQQRKNIPAQHRREVEMLLFLVISALGIYALGNGLTGLFEPGKAIDLLWLAVSGVAMMVLFAQMGRVHDNWPRRKESTTLQQANEETMQQPPLPSKGK